MILVRIDRETAPDEITEVFRESWAMTREEDFSRIIANKLADPDNSDDTVNLKDDFEWDGYCFYNWYIDKGYEFTEYTLDEFIALTEPQPFTDELEALLNARRD